MNKLNLEINTKQRSQLKQLAKKCDLKLILLFGSFATGKNRPDSDLDIAVFREKNPNLEEILELSEELSAIFKKDVDLSLIKTANPLLLFEINKNAVLLHGTKEEFFRFKLRAFHRYNDYLYFSKKLKTVPAYWDGF